VFRGWPTPLAALRSVCVLCKESMAPRVDHTDQPACTGLTLEHCPRAEPHPGKARYVEVLGGKQCSICLHVLRAWAGTHIKSHESSNKHKEAAFRREVSCLSRRPLSLPCPSADVVCAKTARTYCSGA